MALYVISGPPCSGKTTWALDKAGPGDVIIDLDRIAVALSGKNAPSHGHSGAIDKAASAARTAIIADVIDGYAYERVDVFLIHTNPSTGTRGYYASHNAEFVELDPGRDVVEARVRRERPASSMRGVEKWYGQGRRRRLWA